MKATHQNNKTEITIKQSKELINGRFSMDKIESDIFYTALSKIKTSETEFKTISITKKEIEDYTGNSKINAREIRDAILKSMKRVFELYEDEDHWRMYSLIHYAEYNTGIITMKFSEDMKPFILEMKQYIQADKWNVLRMKSHYSRRVYFMLKEYLQNNFRDERRFNVDKLRDKLQTPRSMNLYGDFKRRVILPAIKDINTHSDIKIEDFKEHKEGRKVTEITLQFSYKKRKENHIKSTNKNNKNLHNDNDQNNDHSHNTRDNNGLTLSKAQLEMKNKVVAKYAGTKEIIKIAGYEVYIGENGHLYSNFTNEEIPAEAAMKAWKAITSAYMMQKNTEKAIKKA